MVRCEICWPERTAAERVVARLCLINTPQGHDWELIEPADVGDCQIIDVPDFCAKCGGIMFWWTALGTQRCMGCDPPEVTERLLARARELAAG